MSWSTLSLYLPDIGLTLFFFAVGASMGSMINVLVYRMPLGLSVITPPSRCPACDTRLTWRENIPILGWLLLRGRCRFCRKPISSEYPIVEAFVACLFALFFALWYVADPDTTILGVHVGANAPEWTQTGLVRTWPAFIVLLSLLVGLVSMTIIDARTYTIPLVLAWAPTAVAFVVLPAHAAWFGLDHGPLGEARPGLWLAADGTRWTSARGWLWTLATPPQTGWGAILAGLGGVLGIGVSLLLQRLGLIRHSFADYAEWEQQALAEAKAAEHAATDEPEAPAKESTAPVSSIPPSHSSQSQATDPPVVDPAATVSPDNHDDAQLWIQYPHARREMVIEAAFEEVRDLQTQGSIGIARVLPGARSHAVTSDDDSRDSVPGGRRSVHGRRFGSQKAHGNDQPGSCDPERIDRLTTCQQLTMRCRSPGAGFPKPAGRSCEGPPIRTIRIPSKR